MVIFLFILGVILGVAIGRLYGWMKYHYPEFREEIQAKVADARLRRKQIELREAQVQQEIDEIYGEIVRD
jgi:hypothetical protein